MDHGIGDDLVVLCVACVVSVVDERTEHGTRLPPVGSCFEEWWSIEKTWDSAIFLAMVVLYVFDVSEDSQRKDIHIMLAATCFAALAMLFLSPAVKVMAASAPAASSSADVENFMIDVL